MCRLWKLLGGAGCAVVLGVGAMSGCGSGDNHAADPPDLIDTAGAPPGSKLFGFNDDPEPRTYSLQASLGMPVRRFSVPWARVEPRPGRWDWRRYDGHYSAMVAKGLRPLLVAGGPPCWARPALPCDLTQGPPARAFDSAWIEYVRRLTARYPRAVGIEIWNEPNIAPSFKPRVDPVRYAALLREAYTAVKQVNRGMTVVSGGLVASTRSGAYGMADREFLEAVLAAGAKGSMDAIGAHPYPTVRDGARSPSRYDLAAMERALDRIRAARDAAEASSTPIWITEMGVSTRSAVGYPRGATQARQGRDLLAMVDVVKSDRDIRVALIHRLIDEPPDRSERFPTPVESGFGVFRLDGKPKQAACSLSREFGGSLRC